MTKFDYERLFIKLITQFGSKAFSQDRINLIYDEVKNITSHDFERLVTYFIGHSKTAPLVPEFRKAIYDLGIKFNSEYAAPSRNISDNHPEWDYPVEHGVWANSKYFYFRQPGGKNRFMIKSDCQDHELLEKDSSSKMKWVPFFEKITRPDYDGSLGTYVEHINRAIKTYG